MNKKKDKEGVDLFPRDRYLRSFGFAIHSRRASNEAVWKKDGRLFLQRDALVWVEEQIHLCERGFKS